jgi:hypothetical protein
MGTRFFLLLAALAVAARLLPHPFNFTPLGAMALFGGACLADKRLALGVPLVALFLSDLCLGFHAAMPFVYGSFLLIACLGFALRGRRTAVPLAAATLASSLLFFLVTNFGQWLVQIWQPEPMYPLTAAGLVECYVKAIPFFGNTLLGDAVFVTALFGGLALAEKGLPVVREAAPERA